MNLIDFLYLIKIMFLEYWYSVKRRRLDHYPAPIPGEQILCKMCVRKQMFAEKTLLVCLVCPASRELTLLY